MNIRAKKGQPTTIKLLVQEQNHLESAQGICAVIARNLDGDRAGEAAGVASANLATLRKLLADDVPTMLTPKA